MQNFMIPSNLCKPGFTLLLLFFFLFLLMTFPFLSPFYFFYFFVLFVCLLSLYYLIMNNVYKMWISRLLFKKWSYLFPFSLLILKIVALLFLNVFKVFSKISKSHTSIYGSVCTSNSSRLYQWQEKNNLESYNTLKFALNELKFHLFNIKRF